MEDLGITVTIDVNDAEFDKKVSALNKEITTLKSSANRLKKELKLDPSNLDIMKKRAEELGKALTKAQTVYKSYVAYQQKLVAEGKTSGKEWDDTNTQISKAHDRVLSLQIALNKANQEIEDATNNAKKFTDALDKAGQVSQNISKAFEPISKASQNFLKDATQGAIDFESAFADVEKTVSSTGSDFMDKLMFSDLKDDVKDLSTYLPKTASEIATIMGLAGQMNVPADQLKDFTELMIQFGDSTNITAEEAVTDIAQIYNVIGKGGNFSDLQNLLSAIVELGNNSATTEKDITTMFKNISAGASRVGMTEQQMVALASTLSSVGLDKGGASAISTIMTKIDKAVTESGADLYEWAKIAGMSGETFKKTWGKDSANALLAVVTGMAKMTDEGISMNKILSDVDIKELRQIDTLSRLVNAHEEYAKNIELANSAYENGTALSDEAQKRYKTLASQIQILKNNFELFALSIGETLMPYVQQLVDWLKQLADWLNALDPQTKDAIAKVLLIIAVISPLFGLLSKIAFGITSIFNAFVLLKPIILVVFGAIKTFLTTVLSPLIMFAQAHPIMLAIMAVITVLIILWEKSEGFRETVKMLWDGLKELWEEFKTDAIELLGQGFEWLDGILQEVINFFSSIINWVGKAITAVQNFFGAFSGAGSLLGSLGSGGFGGGGISLINSRGFGEIQSGGFRSGGITLNASFDVQSNNITRNDVRAWSEWLADDINEVLGRRI